MVNIIDYVIIILYFAALLGVGYISMRRAKTSDDYLVAGRMLPMPMFICAMAATVIGGGATLGGSGLAYSAGLGAVWLNGMYFISIFLLAFLLGTKLSNMRILSTSEGIGVFYGPYAKLLGAVINVIYLIMLAVLQIVGMGSILSTLLGWSPNVGMVVGGCIILGYILLGGMWAVAMTDVLQFTVMTVGIIILGPVFALSNVGGFDELVARVPAEYFDLGDIGFQRIIAYVFLLVPGFLAGQDFWQKAFTAKNKSVATKGTLIASLYIAIFGAAVILFGMCLYAVNPNLEDTNQVFAMAAITFIPSGLKGLVLAAALAAIMSTANGGILGCSTVFYNDILKARLRIPANKAIVANRVLCVIITAVAILFSTYLRSVLVALDVAYAYIAGCLFVPLVFAFILKKVSARAGLLSLIASFVTVTVFFVVDGITALSPIIYGILVSAAVFFIVNATDSKKRAYTFDKNGGVYVDGVAKNQEKAE
jgi:SSS family solute:Na+ symporter